MFLIVQSKKILQANFSQNSLGRCFVNGLFDLLSWLDSMSQATLWLD